MVRAKEKSSTCFNLLAEKVEKLKWMFPDETKTKYLKFIDIECILFKDKFFTFDATSTNDHVDTFLGTVLHRQKEHVGL